MHKYGEQIPCAHQPAIEQREARKWHNSTSADATSSQAVAPVSVDYAAAAGAAAMHDKISAGSSAR
jgi:hypothetical protein